MNDKQDIYDRITTLIEEARGYVATTINSTMTYTYFEIGRYIVEDQQQGKQRATYGTKLLKELSSKLTDKFGRGFSYTNLEQMRKFYSAYSIPQTASEELNIQSTLQTQKSFILSWSHYLILMRIKSEAERNFYEIECAEQNWSIEQLKRQYGSSLYERLALSRNKDEVLRLSREGQTIEKPRDILKSPLSLEFLGLKEDSAYSESKLESAIIIKLQEFLLEMGKGFLFEARQKRFTFDEDNFFVDLVFYNRLLQCYVLIDLKINKLSHQDLGQMQMYVNYFDRYVKKDFETPTIGILLCKEKNDSLVELTLPQEANIHASEYMLYLPDKKLLKQKLDDWSEEFDEAKEVEQLNTNQ